MLIFATIFTLLAVCIVNVISYGSPIGDFFSPSNQIAFYWLAFIVLPASYSPISTYAIVLQFFGIFCFLFGFCLANHFFNIKKIIFNTGLKQNIGKTMHFILLAMFAGKLSFTLLETVDSGGLLRHFNRANELAATTGFNLNYAWDSILTPIHASPLILSVFYLRKRKWLLSVVFVLCSIGMGNIMSRGTLAAVFLVPFFAYSIFFGVRKFRVMAGILLLLAPLLLAFLGILRNLREGRLLSVEEAFSPAAFESTFKTDFVPVRDFAILVEKYDAKGLFEGWLHPLIQNIISFVPRFLWPEKPTTGQNVIDTERLFGINAFHDRVLTFTVFGDFYTVSGISSLLVLSFLFGAAISYVYKRCVSGSIFYIAILGPSMITGLVNLTRATLLYCLPLFLVAIFWASIFDYLSNNRALLNFRLYRTDFKRH